MASEPRPRDVAGKYQAFDWPDDGNFIQLPPRSRPLDVDFVELIERRETRRDFNSPMDDEALGEFLWLACRNRSSRPSEFGVDQESRAHPSAGAMHPIHTLVASASGSWQRYDASTHRLVGVSRSKASATATRLAAEGLVELGKGTLLALVAEPGKTAAKYESFESLVWRDAGVVLGYMSVIAGALRLSFCPLGLTGHPYVLNGWTDEGALFAVSLAVVGAPPNP